MRKERGQILVGVIIILMVLAVLVPVMVMYVQNESKWAVKQTQNMTAFQLAEGGVDRGYRKISESTTTWAAGQLGTFPAGYNFNQVYNDTSGGCYTIAISSGPDEDQVTIVSVSKHSAQKEERAIEAIYSNIPMGDTAVYGRSGVTVDGSQTSVEWGAIISPKSITVNGRNHPQMWSSGAIDLDTNGNLQPNCDPACAGWHSYEQDIPPDPGIDVDGFYYAALASHTATPASPNLFTTNQCWGKNSGSACGVPCNLTCSNATDCANDETYYIQGNLCVEGTIFVQGVLVVTGNVSLPNGQSGEGALEARLPRKAWQQYGLNAASWQYYKDMKMTCAGPLNNTPVDPDAPATFPGLSSSYKSDSSRYKCLSKVVVKGFTYIGGNLTQIGGAGSAEFVGAMFVVGMTSVTPNTFTIYYSADAGDYVRTTTVILQRESWKDLPERKWPSWLTCN
ncbi:MAG: hypothetical protein HY924_15015 [Elusimicrobia bacterium]|nr:hypothetical protein [Elusimicrobiota bacterium]